MKAINHFYNSVRDFYHLACF